MQKTMMLTVGLLLVFSFSVTGHVFARTQFESIANCDGVEEDQLAALGCALFLEESVKAEPGSAPESDIISAQAATELPSSGTQTHLFLPIVGRLPAREASFAEQVLDQTNRYRAQNGCGPLVLHPTLNAAAQRHSDDMANRNFFGHTGSDGSTFASRMVQAGYYFSQAAENIGAGYATPADVVDAWMRSPAHRANILNCELTELGLGYSENNGSQYTRYWTQNLGTCE